jgi:hypothetical protein
MFRVTRFVVNVFLSLATKDSVKLPCVFVVGVTLTLMVPVAPAAIALPVTYDIGVGQQGLIGGGDNILPAIHDGIHVSDGVVNGLEGIS